MTGAGPFPTGTRVDAEVAYDTVVVAWVLYCALYCFWLGRVLGAGGGPGRMGG